MPTASQLGVHDVLHIITERFGIEGTERGDEFDFLCPSPDHNERKVGSCSVNLHSGLWKCLACGKAGDLLVLGTLVLGEPYDSIKASLSPSTPEALGATVRTKLAALLHRPGRAKAVALREYRCKNPIDDLLARGFAEETLNRWGIRYVESDILTGKKGDFTIGESVAIPIRDANGVLLAWCYRATSRSPQWQPRYLYTPGVSLSEIWFGLQHHSKSQHITVVEGALDAMWLDECGVPALALLGSEMGKRKLTKLSAYKSVTLFGDCDAAGALAIRRIGESIGNQTSVKVVTYPQRVVTMHNSWGTTKIDPGVLHPVDIELMMRYAQPWTTWLSKNNI